MAKNEKRITITAIDKVIKENFDNKVIDIWHGISVTMKRSLSLTEMLEFVNSVVDSCIGDINGYLPEAMDFSIKSNILSKYTNFSLPDNLKHMYDIIYCSDIVPFVCQYINTEQLREMKASIDKKIDYICNTNITNIQKQMERVVSAFEEMQAGTADMFSDITPEDVKKFVGSLDNSTLSEDKLVQAYLKHTLHSESQKDEAQ